MQKRVLQHPVSAKAIRRFASGEAVAPPGGDLPVARLPAARRRQLGFPPDTEALVRLSQTTVNRHLRWRNQPALYTAEAWAQLQHMLHEAPWLAPQQPGKRNHRYLFFRDALGGTWFAAIKRTTKSGSAGRIYLATYFRMREGQFNKKSRR